MRSLLRSAVPATLLALTASPLVLRAQDKPAPKPLDLSVVAGFTQTNGNANALSTNVGDKLKYVTRGWTLNQDLAFFYGEADDKVNANFWNGGVRAARAITSRVDLFVLARFDRNVLQGISRRFEEGFGIDAKLIVAPKDKLSAQVGGSAFQLTATPGSTVVGKANYPALRLGLDYKHNFTDLAYVQQTAEYLPNLSDSNAYLMNTETSLVAPLSKRLGLKMSYLIRYNAEPPIRNNVQLKKTDTFFSSGITFTY